MAADEVYLYIMLKWKKYDVERGLITLAVYALIKN